MKTFLIFGATSSIAHAFCRAHVSPETHFWLIGRNAGHLNAVAADLRVRGVASCEVSAVAPGDWQALEAALAAGFQRHGGFDVFLATQGMLPDQTACEENAWLVREVMQVNTVEVMQVAHFVAAHFEARRAGVCVIVGSVAGDCGRRGNYVYGSSKAALDIFCEGLRQRLLPDISVVLVKPGPVDTPMTAHLAKTPHFTTPEKVAEDISAAIRRRAAIVYSPGRWRWIMMIIRLLPRQIVKRLQA